MRLRRETSLGIGAIVMIQILISMLAISLLTRMGPAIEKILEENVYSGEAVEDMLALVAETPPGAVPTAFDDALRRAQDNVTEDAERPLLDAIVAHRADAFSHEPIARRELVESLRALGRVNRDSMEQADVQAKRLGQAGAWAAAMLGALALALGVLVYRRLRVRIELPIEALRMTAHRIRAGNLQARCAIDGPHEVQQIATDFNWLLDRWLHTDERPGTPHDEAREAEVRRALHWLLDREASPVVIVDGDGGFVAMNRATMEGGSVPGTAPEEAELQIDDTWEMTEIPGTSLRWATRKGAEHGAAKIASAGDLAKQQN